MMQIIFLNASGVVLSVRDDMESGEWVQEEYTVNATFPYISGKVIERGQRIAFRDPATNVIQMFEIRNVTDIEPEHYQQIIAEHIVVSELSDEHINNKELTDKTPAQALTTALTGTLWSVGNVTLTTQSSGDIARGSVWQAVLAIAQNWNAYITPRVEFNAAGTSITGRYLDIAPAQGTWRGVRLSIDKNMSDSSVVYDDSELLTALYGYGGTVNTSQSGQDDSRDELTFADVVWTATDDHPAKPKGQTYLEDAQATAEYGRNGRARFGYYQNGDIDDPEVLLKKTWEALKQSNTPKISISGTCTDLYRLGYKDEPIRLHDTAIVEIRQTSTTKKLEIIKCTVDLIDPTATRVEIGAYIPNIIYINRDTGEMATTGSTGGGGGGGGGRGQKQQEYKLAETFSTIEKTDDMIGLVVGTRNGNNYIKAGQIGLAINKTGTSDSYESTAYIDANHVNISATSTASTLAGSIVKGADGKLKIIDAGGLYVEKTEGETTSTFGIWDEGNLTGGVMVQQINGQTEMKLKADVINIEGVVKALESYDISCGELTAGKVTATTMSCTNVVDAVGLVASDYVQAKSFITTGFIDLNVADVTVSGNSLNIKYVDGTTDSFSRAATLQAEYGGSNTGVEATYTVKGSPSENFPSGASVTGKFTLHISSAAAWVTEPSGTIRARVDNTYAGDAEAAYKRGWNECRQEMINSGTTLYYYTGTKAVKYDAPSYGANPRDVLYPYSSHSKTVYSVPDAKT